MQAVSEIEAGKKSNATQARATVRTAVAGVGGYAGGELARLLLNHPRLAKAKPLFHKDAWRTRVRPGGWRLKIFNRSWRWAKAKRLPEVRAFSWELILRDAGTEVVFLALPHENSREWGRRNG